jgi:hypothetical protein
MAGVDLKTVRELMGHKTVAMTVRYAHFAPNHRARAPETLALPGSVSVQSGCVLAAGARKPRRAKKVDVLQLVFTE